MAVSLLPQNVPVEIRQEHNLVLWVYGDPKSGKTTFASTFPSPLIISTDNGAGRVTTPRIEIASRMKIATDSGVELEVTGWEYLTKHWLPEMRGQTVYETVIIDLMADVYELCRQHHLEKAGVVHEQDLGSFSKGYQIIRQDFYQFIKDLNALKLNIIYISHVSMTNDAAKDAIKIRPNLSYKVYQEIEGKYINGLIHVYKTVDANSQAQYAASVNAEEPKAWNLFGLTTPIFANYESLRAAIIESAKTL